MKIISNYKNSYADIADINREVENPATFIAKCEKIYYDQIGSIVNEILYSHGRYRIILLAGPSSSGKTTTAHKISEAFGTIGIHAPVVSIDDFFLGIANYPKLPDGSPDMETIETVDIPLVNATFNELLEKGSAVFPIFDFTKSERSDKTRTIDLGKYGVLIVEGTHALNPRLTEFMDQRVLYRVYVSTRTKYSDGDKPLLTPKNSRLIRRMVRDHKFRGRLPIETLKSWNNILDGEEKHIYPYRDSVDFKIDSALDYEGCVFHHYILPLLEDMNSLEGDDLEKITQIKNALEAFDDIDASFIPKESLLREFIGE